MRTISSMCVSPYRHDAISAFSYGSHYFLAPAPDREHHRQSGQLVPLLAQVQRFKRQCRRVKASAASPMISAASASVSIAARFAGREMTFGSRQTSPPESRAKASPNCAILHPSPAS